MRDKLIKYIQVQKDVKIAYLFGSSTKNNVRKLSDIDIGVLLDESLTEVKISELRLKLISDLTSILRTNKVDLVVMNNAPLLLNYEIIKSNYPIFIRNESERIDFECRIMSKYLDRRYYDKRHYKIFLSKVAKRGLSF